MAKSTALRVQCKNGLTSWEFPYEVTLALSAPLYPLTEGQVKQVVKSEITEETATDAVDPVEGSMKQKKAVCVFKYMETGKDPRIHRISIPAPASGNLGIYSDQANSKGEIIPAVKTGTSPGKDGNELATMFKTAMSLSGDLVFLSGKIVQGSTKQ